MSDEKQNPESSGDRPGVEVSRETLREAASTLGKSN